MKIYCAHATSFDFRKDLYEVLAAAPGLSAHQLVFPYAAEKAESSKDIIKSCDLVLAEVSYPSTGMGIELGWADMSGVPIIAVRRKDCVTSSSIRTVAKVIHSYEDAKELIECLERQLAH